MMSTVETTNKELKDMSIEELLAEAMKELEEIKRILGINR